MMLMWVSEVFWDPENDQPGKPVPVREPVRQSASGHDERLPRATRPSDLPLAAESW